MSRAHDVAAAIIAGGQATRLGGRSKALIEIDGATIVEHQLLVLRSLFTEVVVAADDPAPFVDFGLSVVPDRVKGRGPLAGLDAALAHVTRPFLFAVACDMPHIHTRAVELLLGRRSADADVVVPLVNDRPEPLFAIYSRRCLPVIERRLADGYNNLSGLISDGKLAVREVSEEDLRLVDPTLRALTNMNSPTDLP